MKTHFALFLALIIVSLSGVVSFPAHAQQEGLIQIEGEVSQVIFPREKPIEGLHVCLSYLKSLEGTIALVEDSTNCYFARRFRSQVGHWVTTSHDQGAFIEDDELRSILERVAPQAKFLFIDVN